VLAAFLVEYPFYLVPAFPDLRERLSGVILPLYLAASVLLPYLVCYVPNGLFLWSGLVKLAALALALGLWYLVLPVTVFTDLAFLILVGALLLGSYFDGIYLDPYPKLKLAILGRLALFQITVLVLLVERRVQNTGYGFVPNWKEWRIGAVHYLYFLPVAACLALPIGAVRFAPPAPLWKTAGVFLGFFFVVALFEEFVFRGVLQQWLEQWKWSRAASLLIASLAFGCAHLWFTGGGRRFPNWRWALLAAVLGWFCGRARNQAGSIRAGVITHALVVATWREFFV